MKATTPRLVLRCVHLLLAIPILGYVYSPFEAIPDYSFRVRYIFVPLLALSGLLMWLGRFGRRSAARTSDCSLPTRPVA